MNKTQPIRRKRLPKETGYEPSKSRFERLRQYVDRPISKNFNVDDIHWVTDRIGITDYEGSTEAVIKGYYVINVASEVPSSADILIDINPGSGNVKQCLNELADQMEKILTSTNNKIVVHCAMGMERSPLTVVWYLHKYLGMTLDEAYSIVSSSRESTIDRRSWIRM